MKDRNIFRNFIAASCLAALAMPALAQQSPMNAYLFAYFTGNDKRDESIKFAVSRDGVNFTALNDTSYAPRMGSISIWS